MVLIEHMEFVWNENGVAVLEVTNHYLRLFVIGMYESAVMHNTTYILK